MSTYYWLVCDAHRECAPIASMTVGGYCELGDQAQSLPPFAIAHAECAVRIASERDAAVDEYEEWDAENAKQLYSQHRDAAVHSG